MAVHKTALPDLPGKLEELHDYEDALRALIPEYRYSSQSAKCRALALQLMVCDRLDKLAEKLAKLPNC